MSVACVFSSILKSRDTIPLHSSSSPAPLQTPVGPSAPYFFKELKHQPLRPGELTVFEARVVGVPQPDIEWLKDGKALENYRCLFPRTTILTIAGNDRVQIVRCLQL